MVTPIYNANNRLLGFAKITRDLTERRRNEELMQKNKELARINNDLDNFVYTASHDLKAPISNLEGLLDALIEDLGPQKDKYQAILTLIQGAIATLRRIISDLAEITHLQQEKGTAESVNLPELVEEVKESLRELINTHKAEIKVNTFAFENLRYSRKNLRSILYNLVSNAIKYSHPERTPEIIINTYISNTGDYVLSVADNGLGISENQIDKIFTIYKRAHTHVEGSGLGLYLVKKILDNSDDHIVVESKVDKGSVFQVFFKQEPS